MTWILLRGILFLWHRLARWMLFGIPERRPVSRSLDAGTKRTSSRFFGASAGNRVASRW
jgi:hypothetical protein